MRTISLIFWLMKFVINEEVDDFYYSFDPTIQPLKIWQDNSSHSAFTEVIVGNLILTNIQENEWKERFHEEFYEITGYLHLKNIDFNIYFKKLAIIHGEELEPETGAALLIENCTMDFINITALQLIKKGRVVIKDCPNLCYWNPNEINGVNYAKLVRPVYKGEIKDIVNSRIFVSNSFGNCNGELTSCIKNRGFGCLSEAIPQVDPTQCSYTNANCAFGCRKVLHNAWASQLNRIVVQCNSCPNGLYLDLRNGTCTACHDGKKLANLYCKRYFENDAILDDDKALLMCEKGYTMDKDLNKCVKCPIDLTVSGKLINHCLKPCRDNNMAYSYAIINRFYPKFSLENYDKDNELEEHELCGIIVVTNALRLNVDLPPLSSLWFLSRIQYAPVISIPKHRADVLLFGNTRSPSKNSISVDALDLKYIDVGLAENSGSGTNVLVGKKQWFKPLKKIPPNRFPDVFREYVGKSIDDCRCGYSPKRTEDVCFVPGNCLDCNYGHRQYIDPQTKMMFTRCSKTNYDNMREYVTTKDEMPPNTIFPCHETCAPVGCSGRTAFDCKKCSKLDLWTNNMARSCVKKCPLGYYKEKMTKSHPRCLRCHKACRGGCTGPAAGKGYDGCNDCFAYISAPKNSKYSAICMAEFNNSLPNVPVIDLIIFRLKA
uniref:Receptor L-domain domain-containing protein n=1 Tax=Panagrolaimus sp. JU765 TaxID=591449 RepID=A0AC34RA01_9BILA